MAGGQPGESRYEAALAAALAIIHKLTSKPGMPRHERLACMTFSILEAMDRLEERRKAGAACPEPSVN